MNPSGHGGDSTSRGERQRRPVDTSIFSPRPHPSEQPRAERSDSKAAQNPKVVFTASSPFQDKKPRALLVTCSGARFSMQIDAFLQNILGSLDGIDRLQIPGGPGAACMMGGVNSNFFAVEKHIQELHHFHQLSQLIAIAHHDCSAYGAKFKGESDSVIMERQIKHLREFSANTAKKLGAGIRIRCFYASVNSQGLVEFLEV